MFYGRLVHFTRFGMLYQDKSGNPGKSRLAQKKFFWAESFLVFMADLWLCCASRKASMATTVEP
jgi:hypothetical protein